MTDGTNNYDMQTYIFRLFWVLRGCFWLDFDLILTENDLEMTENDR